MLDTSKDILKKIAYISTIVVVIVLGALSMALPFLPFGWVLFFVALILLLPYFPFFRRWAKKLEKKDNTGLTKKMKKYVETFYCWAYDADEMDC